MKCPKCAEEMKESIADKRFYVCFACKKLFAKRGLETVKKETKEVKNE